MSYVDIAEGLVRGELTMTTEAVVKGTDKKSFPSFLLQDINFWIIKRKDGTLVKYKLARDGVKAVTKSTSTSTSSQPAFSASSWCKEHKPEVGKDYVFKSADGKVELYIADYEGAPKIYQNFDLAIDCGNIITPAKWESAKLTAGSIANNFAAPLEQFVIKATKNTDKVLWIEWADRAAPPVTVKFWTALAAQLQAVGTTEKPFRVLTVCHGGHGRSGTALTALMMALSTYSPLEAITHLRAVHCPRAIESAVQHDYLNILGGYLNREKNAHDTDKVKDYKATFLAMTNPFAKEAQDRLKEKA